MSEEEYQSAIQKQGLHSFVVVMSTLSLDDSIHADFTLRAWIISLAAIAAAGLAFAWNTSVRGSELQLRLIRAAELTKHLREMNVAAAGLAHETRNPLNIVRGLAQLITRHADAPDEIRRRARDILDESDRITAQLNEFINYARPRDVRLAPVSIHSVIDDVVRTLHYDIEDKQISVLLQIPSLTIQADEPLLRQALFNLVLNAIQAVPNGGKIEIDVQPDANGESTALTIRDNGPGVPAHERAEIFKPYFSTRAGGTGLGLAVVAQIVLAHGWEIECSENTPNGAIFKISHVKPVA